MPIWIFQFLTYSAYGKQFTVILYIKPNGCINLFLVYLSISACFGRLCAHHQEKQLCFCDTWYLSFCVDDCLVCRVEWNIPPCIPDSHPHRITSTKCCKNTVVSPDDGHIFARNMQRLINIIRINSCTQLVLFTRLYSDARSTNHKTSQWCLLGRVNYTLIYLIYFFLEQYFVAGEQTFIF